MSEDAGDALTAEAVNRNTRAVRAIARFVLLSTLWSLIGALPIAIGILQVTTGWIVFGSLITLGGIVYALFAGFEELSLSQPPGNASKTGRYPARKKPQKYVAKPQTPRKNVPARPRQRPNQIWGR